MAYMVDKYGDDMFQWMKGNETKYLKQQKFLKRHFLRKETRAKMVDWMLEVFYLTKSDAYLDFIQSISGILSSVLLGFFFFIGFSSIHNAFDNQKHGFLLVSIVFILSFAYPALLRLGMKTEDNKIL